MTDFVRIQSDYSPDTYLTITMSEDGDIALKIYGDDEMRITTSGSRFHGKDLAKILNAFQNVMSLIDEVQKKERNNEKEVNKLICKDCAKRFSCSFNACERNSCDLYESDSELIKVAIELLQNYLENKEIEHGPSVYKRSVSISND